MGDLEYHLWEQHNETSPPLDQYYNHKHCNDCGDIILLDTNACNCGNTENFSDPGDITYL